MRASLAKEPFVTTIFFSVWPYFLPLRETHVPLVQGQAGAMSAAGSDPGECFSTHHPCRSWRSGVSNPVQRNPAKPRTGPANNWLANPGLIRMFRPWLQTLA